MKYSIHILTTHKHESRQRSVLDTWLKGRSNYNFYTDRKLDVGNQFVVCENDTYFSNGIKNLSELHRIYYNNLHETVDWMLFCDDDTFVNLPGLEKLLPTLNPDKVYGQILTWAEDRTLSYCSGGAGYLVSSKILKRLGPPSLDYLNISFYSDVCIGLWCRDNNILVENLDQFHGQPPEFYNLPEHEVINCITFHYIKTMDQHLKLTNIFNNIT